MATAKDKSRNKLRILLMPFFAASHIGPFTDLAFHLAAARPDDPLPTSHSTSLRPGLTTSRPPSLSLRRMSRSSGQPSPGVASTSLTKIRPPPSKVATYPFPSVDDIPPGVENLSTVRPADGWRIDSVAHDDKLMRPRAESLIREHAPDAVISDVHFWWNVDIAADIGVPCITFHIVGTFPALATTDISNNKAAGMGDAIGGGLVTLPEFLAPGKIQVPITELPELLRRQQEVPDDNERATDNPVSSAHKRCFRLAPDNPLILAHQKCFGVVVNTFFGLEHRHCEMFGGYMKHAYFVGPLLLPSLQVATSAYYFDWLDKKPPQSVVYLCFGSLAHVSEAQLRELALGLEASEKPFLWVIRSETWVPPEGWKERVGDKGVVVSCFAPQIAILAHRAVGAFVTHCGWNSILETVVAGVPVLTWPMMFEQFLNERFITKVLAIGERLWPEDTGVRSTRSEEHELVPAHAVARAVATFMEPGGSRDEARSRVRELSAKAHAAMAEGGSSYRDLHRLIDDLMEAAAVGAGPVLSV